MYIYIITCHQLVYHHFPHSNDHISRKHGMLFRPHGWNAGSGGKEAYLTGRSGRWTFGGLSRSAQFLRCLMKLVKSQFRSQKKRNRRKPWFRGNTTAEFLPKSSFFRKRSGKNIKYSEIFRYASAWFGMARLARYLTHPCIFPSLTCGAQASWDPASPAKSTSF